MADERIGLIGLGNMGGRMGRRLVEHGKTVVGFDVVAGRAEAIGAEPASSVVDVTGRSDYVLLSLPDSHAVEAVILGSDGLLEHSRPGQVVIDLSTSSPASTASLYAKARDRGVDYLDAGISGGAAAAEKGTLTIMVGGSRDVLQAAASVFEPIAKKVVWMGRSGAGHTTKLLNNFLNAVSLAATAEVMVAAKKAGLDLEQVLEVLNSSSGVNFATLNRFPHIVKGDYLEGGLTGSLMTKDLALYVDCVHDLGVPCLNASGPLASFGLANNLGYADVISNRVVDAIGDVAGRVRLYEPADGGQEESAS